MDSISWVLLIGCGFGVFVLWDQRRVFKQIRASIQEFKEQREALKAEHASR